MPRLPAGHFNKISKIKIALRSLPPLSPIFPTLHWPWPGMGK